jgi:hypothetical protein
MACSGKAGPMSSKDRFQKRARAIQKDTGWSYSECLRLSRESITEEALAVLKQMRTRTKGEGR